MKLSYDQARTLARVCERYVYEAERYIKNNFRGHVEFPKNKNLLVELVQDMTLLAEIYPNLLSHPVLENGIESRLEMFESRTRPQEVIENNLPPTEDDLYGLLSNVDDTRT